MCENTIWITVQGAKGNSAPLKALPEIFSRSCESNYILSLIISIKINRTKEVLLPYLLFPHLAVLYNRITTREKLLKSSASPLQLSTTATDSTLPIPFSLNLLDLVLYWPPELFAFLKTYSSFFIILELFMDGQNPKLKQPGPTPVLLAVMMTLWHCLSPGPGSSIINTWVVVVH